MIASFVSCLYFLQMALRHMTPSGSLNSKSETTNKTFMQSPTLGYSARVPPWIKAKCHSNTFASRGEMVNFPFRWEGLSAVTGRSSVRFLSRNIRP